LDHNSSLGLWVGIDHGNGYVTAYGHFSALTVAVGDRVGTQWQVGTSGTTGSSTGPHLHMATYYYPSWSATDPFGWTGNYPDPNIAADNYLWVNDAGTSYSAPLLSASGSNVYPGATLVDDGGAGWSSTGSWSTAASSNDIGGRSEEHTSELQSQSNLVCRLLLEKKNIVHTTWPVVPGRFKDYVSTPKQNDYRSIHTTVIGPSQQRVELQIRTRDMHEIAEYGIAAHALYKDSVGSPTEMLSRESSAYAWLRRTIELLAEGSNPEEFLEHTKLELFHDQVFCFTPKGKLIALPRGANAIDFAYAVHTDVGNMAVGCKINGG